MKKWSKKKKITILLLFLVLLALFAGLCWKKRRGIYNTYMKLTNQEIPYSVKEKRKKKYGYYYGYGKYGKYYGYGKRYGYGYGYGENKVKEDNL